MERWKKVADYPAYEVSDMGQIRRNGRIHKPDYNKDNPCSYPRIKFCKDGKYSKWTMVHLLVLEAFVGPKPEGFQANHKDGNKANACLANLEYVTPSENHKHSYEVLGQKRMKGSLHGMSKLTEDQVKEIRSLRENVYETGVPWKGKGRGLRIRYQLGSGKTLSEIAKRFGIGKPMVSLIVNGKNWKHVPSSQDGNPESHEK